jgi:hypothetical protein
MRCGFVVLIRVLAVTLQLASEPDQHASNGIASANNQRSGSVSLVNYSAAEARKGMVSGPVGEA